MSSHFFPQTVPSVEKCERTQSLTICLLKRQDDESNQLTEPSEHVIICLKLGLYTIACIGSLWVSGTSACSLALKRSKDDEISQKNMKNHPWEWKTVQYRLINELVRVRDARRKRRAIVRCSSVFHKCVNIITFKSADDGSYLSFSDRPYIWSVAMAIVFDMLE